ncbi:MAG: carbon-nitrogen hydrolase family protein [Planctomycetaceae bacterium]|nr:carbon-nitrogen hydrolase family protein [Planctomycetaceae bacterium]
MRIAGVQMDVRFAEPAANLERILEFHSETRSNGADLTIFPECAVTGYCFDSLAEALPYAEEIPGPSIERLQAGCASLGGAIVVGLLEREGDRVFNVATLVDETGVLASYRKVHLPWLGVDRYTAYGDRPFSVTTCGDVKVGLNICYDAGFPEPARCLTLLGADLIVLPTNWPPGAQSAADYAINTRAMENTVYFAAVNRVGVERGTAFIGHSRICDPLGRTLAEARHTEEAILYADIDVALSRRKHLVRAPGTNEVNRIADRRPEMYRPIIEPHTLVRPGGR